MDIIIPPAPYTEDTRYKALLREFRTGEQLYRAMEEKREIKARAEAKMLMNHTPIKALAGMRCRSVIPEEDYFKLVRKYGRQEVASPEFQNYLGKKFPELCPHRT